SILFSVHPGGSTTMRPRSLILFTAALVASAARPAPALASDHADTAENVNRVGADLTDVFIFPNPSNARNVVLVMNAHGLIPAGQAGKNSFDPNVLYQFKIDNDGDYVEDLVIQVRFRGTGKNQQVVVSGPHPPLVHGTVSFFGPAHPHVGKINRVFFLANG